MSVFEPTLSRYEFPILIALARKNRLVRNECITISSFSIIVKKILKPSGNTQKRPPRFNVALILTRYRICLWTFLSVIWGSLILKITISIAGIPIVILHFSPGYYFLDTIFRYLVKLFLFYSIGLQLVWFIKILAKLPLHFIFSIHSQLELPPVVMLNLSCES